MLPFVGFAHAKVRCPKCKRDEVRFRAGIIIGTKHKCPYCKTRYRIEEILPMSVRKAR